MSPRRLTAEERIARALRGLKLDQMKQDTAKSDSILIRITPDEKEQIKAVAEVLEISVAEYLLGLHREALVHIRRPRSSE